jgi:hypothetical protein
MLVVAMGRSTWFVIAIIPFIWAGALVLALENSAPPLARLWTDSWLIIAVGSLLYVIGAFVTASNLFFSVAWPLLFRVRHRTYDGFRDTSGIPLVGTLLLANVE